MGVRYRSEFTNDLGVDYKIDITDSSYVGTIRTFKASAEGYSCQIEQEGDSRNQPFKTSKFSIDCHVIASDVNFESFISDINGAEMNRFHMLVYVGGTLDRGGPVLTDQIIWPDDEPYFYTIAAFDSLSQLKDIPYDNGGTLYDAKQTFIEIILNCLNKLSIATNVIGSGQPFLKTYVNWYESNMSNGVADDPLDLSRVDSRAWWVESNESDSSFESLSCWEVLEQVLTGWNCRLIMDGGVFNVVQVNTYKNSSANYRVYDFDGVRLSSGSDSWDVDVDQANVYRLATPTRTFDPAVKKAVAVYNHKRGFNLLPRRLEYDTAEPLLWRIIQGGSGTGHVLRVKGSIRFTITNRRGTTLTNFCKGMALTLRVGSNYLEKDKDSDSMIWDNSASVAMFVTRSVGALGDGIQTTLDIDLDFTTPEIPATSSANNTFQLEPNNWWFNPYNNLATIVPATTYVDGDVDPFSAPYAGDLVVQYEVRDMFVQWLPQGREPDTTKTFSATNAPGGTAIDESNEINVEPELLFGIPIGSEPGGFEVYDGVDWDAADPSFRVGTVGTTYDFTQLLVNELIAGQNIPIEILSATIYGAFNPMNRLKIGTSYYIFNGGSFDADRAEWSGEWILSRYDAADVATDDPIGNIPLRLTTNSTNQVSNSEMTINQNRISKLVGAVGGITRTSAFVDNSGAITTISIDAIDPASGFVYTVLNVGDKIFLVDPITGEKESFTINATVDSNDTSMTVISSTPTNQYPVGALVNFPILKLPLLNQSFSNGVTGAVSCTYSTLNGSFNTLNWFQDGKSVVCSGQLRIATAGTTGAAEVLSLTLPFTVTAGTVVSGQMSLYNSGGALKRVTVQEDKYFAAASASLSVQFIKNLNTAARMLDTDLANGDLLSWSIRYIKD